MAFLDKTEMLTTYAIQIIILRRFWADRYKWFSIVQEFDLVQLTLQEQKPEYSGEDRPAADSWGRFTNMV